MDRNTVLAIVLIAIVVIAGFTIQGALSTDDSSDQLTVDSRPVSQDPATPAPTTEFISTIAPVDIPVVIEDQIVYRDEGVMEVVFDQFGGHIDAITLLAYSDAEGPIEILYDEGEQDSKIATYISDNPEFDNVAYQLRVSDGGRVYNFTRQFSNDEGVPFDVVKTYTFVPGEFAIKYEISITNSVNRILPLSADGIGYTIEMGEKMGPSTSLVDVRFDFRRFVWNIGGDRKNWDVNANNTFNTLSERVEWIGFDGKYFSLVIAPDAVSYTYEMRNSRFEDNIPSNKLIAKRAPISASQVTDTYYIFPVPKQTEVLSSFKPGDSNPLGLNRDYKLEILKDTGIFTWLENIMKFFLAGIQSLVGNWGVAVLILTTLLRLALFPLSRKGIQSTQKMSALGPKMQEIREKYKDEPQKMNMLLAELYKKEGVNPLGSCLPLLLQFPFLIAMFGVFNNDFDIRGAVFIPGWIDDLSLPESIFNFGDFTIPIIGWNDIRLLPFLYIGTMFLTSTLQAPQTGATGGLQQKIMKYGLPLIFFFLLYNNASGLMLYWTFQNILVFVQQKLTQRSIKKPK